MVYRIVEHGKKIQDIIINYCSRIKHALTLLQKNKKRFLICVDEHSMVVGVVTDGDIRRAFLNNLTIEDSLEKVYNSKFQYLNLNSNFDDVCDLFKSDKIDFLPILDQNRKLINVLTKKQFHIMLLEDIVFSLEYDFFKFDAYSIGTSNL